jgi:hypothetical protein
MQRLSPLLAVPAVIHALFGWTVTLLFTLAGTGDRPFEGPLVLAITLLPVAILSILLAITFEIFAFPISQQFIWRLILSYFTLILVFANVYFLLIFIEPRRFDGIHSPWTQLPDLQGRRLHMRDAILTAIDCFHLSCMTITTVGYGDMRPVHWVAKLATDAEVLSGLSVITVGFGRFFGTRNAA